MDTLQRIAGVFLILVAAAVAVHTVAEPLYHASTEAQPYSEVWVLLDWIMAAAIVVGLLLSHRDKRAADGSPGDAVTRRHLAANVRFYGLCFVGILFFWSWFNLLSPDFTAAGEDTVSIIWLLVDAGLPLVLGSIGFSLRARS